MTLITQITHYLQIVFFILLGIAALVFAYIKLFRKKKLKSRPANMRRGKVRDATEYVPVDSISGNIYKVSGENRFLASINCKGFDFFSVDVEEQFAAQDGYLAFVNTISSPITMRIDSSAVDLTYQIKKHEEAYLNKYNEQGRLYQEYNQYVKALENLPDGAAESRVIVSALNEINRQIECNQWKMQHIEHIISYQKSLSGREATPLQEERYIFDWTFNPKDFPDSITESEIRERAEKELAQKENQMRHALSRSNVKVRRDTDQDIYSLFFRHFHPWSSSAYHDNEESNAEERIVSGKRAYEHAKREYERLKESHRLAELSAAYDRLTEEEIKGYGDSLEDYDDDDFILGDADNTLINTESSDITVTEEESDTPAADVAVNDMPSDAEPVINSDDDGEEDVEL